MDSITRKSPYLDETTDVISFTVCKLQKLTSENPFLLCLVKRECTFLCGCERPGGRRRIDVRKVDVLTSDFLRSVLITPIVASTRTARESFTQSLRSPLTRKNVIFPDVFEWDVREEAFLNHDWKWKINQEVSIVRKIMEVANHATTVERKQATGSLLERGFIYQLLLLLLE